MVYILDPDRRVYAADVRSKVNAICQATRRYDPLNPLLRATAVRYVWNHMQAQGYSLLEGAIDSPLANSAQEA